MSFVNVVAVLVLKGRGDEDADHNNRKKGVIFVLCLSEKGF